MVQKSASHEQELLISINDSDLPEKVTSIDIILAYVYDNKTKVQYYQ